MNKSKFILLMVSLMLALAFIFSCSSSDEGNEDKTETTPSPALKAEPIAADKSGYKPEILYSWTDGTKNHYVINAGYIDNSLLMENGFHYSGYGSIGISTTKTVETSMAESRTNTVSSSVVVKNSSTEFISLKEAITTGVKTSTEAGAQTSGIAKFFVKGSVKASIETNIETSEETITEITNSFETTTGRTTETSESFETSLKQSWTNSIGLSANRGDPTGYYRYAWYIVSDVYFVISTSLNNLELLNWEVVSVPREDFELRQEYSPEEFDNSPIEGSEIVFADGFWKMLPQPSHIILPQDINVKTETVFNSTVAGNHTYTFDKGFPATVEIYALGAGGGGQGGYEWDISGSANANKKGTGGGGGGGAASYIKFNITELTTFNITVGEGGNGGKFEWHDGGADCNLFGLNCTPFLSDWRAGYTGNNGGLSSVTITDNKGTFVTGGGIGGGMNRSDNSKGLSGGTGGSATNNFLQSTYYEWSSNDGNDGTTGYENSSVKGIGGVNGSKSTSLYNNIFSSDKGNGGNGGYFGEYGSKGGDGQVIIVVTYPEN